MRLLVLFVLCGLGGYAVGQAARAPLIGMVRDRTGKPWSGAEVTLFGRPIPGNEWIGEPDRVIVRTGANGRFKSGEILDVGAEGIDVYNTMLDAMGVTDRLGDPKRKTKAIDSLRA